MPFLLQSDSGFTSIGLSFFTAIVMMVGEVNYHSSVAKPASDNDPSTLRFETMTFFMLSLFLLLMPILLMNLLVRT